jgi:hypothetical protein
MLIPVWVEGWQHQCCGEDFAVGDEVRWTLVEGDEDWHRSVLGEAYPSWEADLDLDSDQMVHSGRTETEWVVRRRGGLAVTIVAARDQPGQTRRVGLPGEEHHHDAPQGAPQTLGTVRRIRVVYCRYAAPVASELVEPVPGSATFVDATKALKWPDEGDERRFIGYLVDLDVAEDSDTA